VAARNSLINNISVTSRSRPLRSGASPWTNSERVFREAVEILEIGSLLAEGDQRIAGKLALP
jgi:hypothetical protein